MLSYSPMDNIRKQPYPPTLFQAGLNDQRLVLVVQNNGLKVIRVDIYIFC